MDHKLLNPLSNYDFIILKISLKIGTGAKNKFNAAVKAVENEILIYRIYVRIYTIFEFPRTHFLYYFTKK